jgi:hypothetical protein
MKRQVTQTKINWASVRNGRTVLKSDYWAAVLVVGRKYGHARGLLDPAWKTLHDIKAEHIRDEPRGFIAERIVPR